MSDPVDVVENRLADPVSGEGPPPFTEGEREAYERVVEALDATPAPFEPARDLPPPVADRSHAVVVTALDTEDRTAERHVIEDLVGEKTILAVTGEEGEGKTLLADQICRQALRGEAVLDLFTPGELRPGRVLFVDTEQEEPEARRRWADMADRGLSVLPASMFWLTAGALDLSVSGEDRDHIRLEVERLEAELLWIDSGGNAVGDPKDDISVRAFFNYLGELLRTTGLVAIGLTLHPRKRVAGDYGRRFDDLFGSREWKGRLTKALYIDGARIVCWKDRGSHIGRLWPRKAGTRYPQARLERPGLADPCAVPFRVEVDEPTPEVDVDAVAARAVALVSERPGYFTRTSLAESLDVRRQDALAIVGGLVRESRIGPDKQRAKLYVAGEAEGSPGVAAV